MITFDVFVSHSSKDKTVADATCAALEAAGIRCWIAPRDVTPGHSYGEDLIDALDACRVMVLVFSSSSNASPQIAREVERCVSRGVTIVPLRIENVVPTKAMAYFVGSVHWLDAMAPPLEQHLRRLVSAVNACLPLAPENTEEKPIVHNGGPKIPELIPQSVTAPTDSVQEQAARVPTEPTPNSQPLAGIPQQHERIGLAYSGIGALLSVQGLLQILCNAMVLSVFVRRLGAITVLIETIFILIGLSSIIIGISVYWKYRRAFTAGLIISILCILISLVNLFGPDDIRMFPSVFPYLVGLSVMIGVFSGGWIVYPRSR
jgi:hypothetical protein